MYYMSLIYAVAMQTRGRCPEFMHETYLISLQLENIIGKVKTEKYGSRILEQVTKYADSAQPDEVKEEENENRASKRLKSKKQLILVESSDDES